MKRIITISIAICIVVTCLFDFAACGKMPRQNVSECEENAVLTSHEPSSYERLTAFIVSNGTENKSENSTYEYTIVNDGMRDIKASYIPISDRVSMSYKFTPDDFNISFVTTFDISLSDINTVRFDTNLWEDETSCHFCGELSKNNMSPYSGAKLIYMVPDDYEDSDIAINFGVRSVIASLDYLNDLMQKEGLGTVSDFGYSDTVKECYALAK